MAELRLGRIPRHHAALLRQVAITAGRRSEPVLVGGAVRDALLGRRAGADLDVAVPGGAVDLARRLAERVRGRFVLLDGERGAARVLGEGVQIDIVDFRRPGLHADLAARDFTVNALAVPLRPLLRSGRARVVDPTGGVEDLAARRLRPFAAEVLAEDPLRALRGIRLEAELDLRLTGAAARAIRAVAPGLGAVAPERIGEELRALLGLAHTARALRRADRLGVLAAILPDVEPMRATPQPEPHRFDVLEHSLRAVDGADRVVARPGALEPFGEETASHLRAMLGGGFTRGHALKLAALLHDVAKPRTRRVIGGRVRFFEHDVIGAGRARELGQQLRLPGAVTSLIERLVRHHLRPMHLGAAGEVTARARYRLYRDLGPDTRDLLVLALVDAAAVRGQSPLRLWRQGGLLPDLMAGVAVQQRVSAAPSLVGGTEVMAHFGLAPGPEVGRLLGLAREAQDLGLIGTRDEALAFLDSKREPS
jgi:putative nucleotidyltransferase with HDIG domain